MLYIDTDHKLVSFDLDLNIYNDFNNFKYGNWSVLKEILMNSPWNLFFDFFVDNDVNASLSG